MSTFKQLVESYASNIEQQRSNSEKSLDDGFENLIKTTKRGYFSRTRDSDFAGRVASSGSINCNF